MTYYIGNENSLADLVDSDSRRYFYALRRDDEGLLFFAKVDQIHGTDTVVINNPGLAENDFTDFEYGVDFFDGRSAADHSRPYSNLRWDQYRWDNKNIFYYLDDAGNFVARINQKYTYPPELIVTP
jgi:hypothetical protein